MLGVLARVIPGVCCGVPMRDRWWFRKMEAALKVSAAWPPVPSSGPPKPGGSSDDQKLSLSSWSVLVLTASSIWVAFMPCIVLMARSSLPPGIMVIPPETAGPLPLPDTSEGSIELCSPDAWSAAASACSLLPPSRLTLSARDRCGVPAPERLPSVRSNRESKSVRRKVA